MRKAGFLQHLFRKTTDRHQVSHLCPMNIAFLMLIWTGISQAQKDCTGVECKHLENCIAEVLEPGECCATCQQHGCTCEGYQYYDCVNVGFINGKVPEGQSYFVDFGSTECSCPKGGGKISCQFMLCPDLPPNCIDAVLPSDGCPQCGRIGCVQDDQKYAAGHTFHVPPCKVCHCPNSGGDLMCYELPDCNESTLNPHNLSETDDVEPERHYDDPYSYDQEAPDGDTTQVEPPRKYYSYSAHTEQESIGQEQSEDYDYLANSVTPSSLPPSVSQVEEALSLTPTNSPTPHPETSHTTEKRTSRSTISITESPQTTHKMVTSSSIPKEPVVATTGISRNMAEAERKHQGNRARQEQEENARFKIKLTMKKDNKQKENKLMVFKESNVTQSQGLNSLHEKQEGDHFPKVKFNPTLPPPIALKEDHNQISPKQSQTLYHYQPEEEVDPNSVHTSSRLPEGSTKDLIETCCAAGQQWAIDNSECTETPVSGTDGDICRIAQKQCCVSYLKENSCIAGMVAAREGDLCGPDESDTCGGSFYKQCCDCCSLGLRVKTEGQKCESNPNLGYPCNHVMLSCCEGEDHLILPELKRHPEPLPTAAPEKHFEEDGQNPTLADTATVASEASNIQPGTNNSLHAEQEKCKDNGPCKHMCQVVEGKIMCSCLPGFALILDGVSCEDINECVTDAHTCKRGEHCINTIGSFTCLQQLSCHSGYELKDRECVDIDECVRGTHSCKINFVCQNTKGSFYCESKQRCMDGFLQDPEGNCVDINECTSLSEPCKPGFNCINTVGSYTCQRNLLICSRGYHSSEDGTRCVDVDECQAGVHRCGEGQVCHNLPGTYRCECKIGYQYDAFSRTCIDLNECWNYPGRLCQHSCENTPGSYHCSCSSGFRLAHDGKHCEDVNECDNNPCSQECANIYGSYQCYCRQGYQLAEDGHSCKDIDECTQSAGILCTFRCINVPGSYQCVCPDEGYTMSANGRTCRDIDECALGNHNCSSAQSCYNIQGSFRCLLFECPANYRKVSDMRCERINCFNYLDCQNTPLRITYYQLNFQTNIVVPAHIFRIGPSPAYAGDNIILTISKGNEENYFSTRKLNSYTGIVYLKRQVKEPKDFLLDVEMKLWRQGTYTTFMAKIYIFITSHVY
ncbi:fibulin-2 isoform X2 [Paroedura picta]|uniref:fibulin-2 isoform X2 n=1 Tax=Paroedura picta TaxID=143630 RepID=UPI004055C7AD